VSIFSLTCAAIRAVDRAGTPCLIRAQSGVIAEADYIVDLGHEDGAEGGKFVRSEPPNRFEK